MTERDTLAGSIGTGAYGRGIGNGTGIGSDSCTVLAGSIGTEADGRITCPCAVDIITGGNAVDAFAVGIVIFGVLDILLLLAEL